MLKNQQSTFITIVFNSISTFMSFKSTSVCKIGRHEAEDQRCHVLGASQCFVSLQVRQVFNDIHVETTSLKRHEFGVS